MINNIGKKVDGHNLSPPSIMRTNITKICLWTIAILSMTGTAYAGENSTIETWETYNFEKPVKTKKKKTGFEGKIEAYSFKQYLDGVNASDNPWVKIEWKWQLNNGLYAWAGITQSFSDEWEWKTEFWNTRYVKGGWKWDIVDIWIHAWWAVADTAIWEFWDNNFTKGTLELSKWDFTGVGYISSIESSKKWKKWYKPAGTKWGNGWWAWVSYNVNDNFDIGFMTWKEAKSWMNFSEIVAGVQYKIAKNLYAWWHVEYQLQWSEAWNIEPRFTLTYKIKPKTKKDKKYKS